MINFTCIWLMIRWVVVEDGRYRNQMNWMKKYIYISMQSNPFHSGALESRVKLAASQKIITKIHLFFGCPIRFKCKKYHLPCGWNIKGNEASSSWAIIKKPRKIVLSFAIHIISFVWTWADGMLERHAVFNSVYA